jgi:hypothetical protein
VCVSTHRTLVRASYRSAAKLGFVISPTTRPEDFETIAHHLAPREKGALEHIQEYFAAKRRDQV